MGFPTYLIGIGIPLLVGLLGLSYFFELQKNYEYFGHREYNYDFYNESESEEECTICLQNITSLASTQLPCGHWLHTACLGELKKRSKKATCPQCRAAI